jgi:hypothetical protein
MINALCLNSSVSFFRRPSSVMLLFVVVCFQYTDPYRGPHMFKLKKHGRLAGICVCCIRQSGSVECLDKNSRQGTRQSRQKAKLTLSQSGIEKAYDQKQTFGQVHIKGTRVLS